MGEEEAAGGRGRKGAPGNFQGDRSVRYLDCADGHTGVESFCAFYTYAVHSQLILPQQSCYRTISIIQKYYTEV